jgi:hypothetical protein
MTSITKPHSANRKGIWITALLLGLMALAFFVGSILQHR